jgi:hypothetical protein
VAAYKQLRQLLAALEKHTADEPGMDRRRLGRQRADVHSSSGYADNLELWESPVATGARRHGITDEDIRHALRNLIAVAADPHDDDVTLFLGPDRAVNLIEVGVLDTDDGPLIIHAMTARTGRFQPPKRSDYGSNHR